MKSVVGIVTGAIVVAGGPPKQCLLVRLADFPESTYILGTRIQYREQLVPLLHYNGSENSR